MLNSKRHALWLFSNILLLAANHCCQAKIKSYQKNLHGIGCRLAKGKMNIYVLKEDIVKVKYASLQKLDANRSLIISLVYSYLKNFTVSANKDEIIITTTKLKIKIKKTNQAIAFTDLNNVLVNGKSISNHTINASDKGNKEITIVLG